MTAALGISVNGDYLQSIDMLWQECEETFPSHGLAKLVADQLKDYFCNPRTTFTFPLKPHGTAFQKRVWCELQNIDRGHPKTYGQLAKNLNSGARAVGGACRHNPIPIIIPCHRVVSAAGIGGFGGVQQGPQLTLKKWLLDHEA